MRSTAINEGSAEISKRIDRAVRSAAGVLRSARRPLVCGLGAVSTEAQRQAVAIADHLGGVADWTSGPADAASTIAFQTVGASTASYGEAAERGDLLVYWRCPALPLPGFDRIGKGVKRAVVEVGGARLPLADACDYEAIAVLRALIAGVDCDAEHTADATGVPLDAWRRLAEQLTRAAYAVIVQGTSLSADGHASVASLTRLAQELQAASRVAIVSPLATGNDTGAESVLTWQTGFPLAVDFGRGYPRYLPGEAATAVVLKRNECDAVLRLADRGMTVSQVVGGDQVAVAYAPLAEGGGTYYRSDGLALPLGRSGGGPPASEVLAALLRRLCLAP
ncbi:MAG: hypothetical protein AAGB00_06730 [Planctomycetota bacterium]